ncbi:hypothetical protein FHG87_003295 [Trinorchestia longiramus]|nr:hypothetical protein FHG87_003295 [Trinorchestia longiramus]
MSYDSSAIAPQPLKDPDYLPALASALTPLDLAFFRSSMRPRSSARLRSSSRPRPSPRPRPSTRLCPSTKPRPSTRPRPSTSPDSPACPTPVQDAGTNGRAEAPR